MDEEEYRDYLESQGMYTNAQKPAENTDDMTEESLESTDQDEEVEDRSLLRTCLDLISFGVFIIVGLSVTIGPLVILQIPKMMGPDPGGLWTDFQILYILVFGGFIISMIIIDMDIPLLSPLMMIPAIIGVAGWLISLPISLYFAGDLAKIFFPQYATIIHGLQIVFVLLILALLFGDSDTANQNSGGGGGGSRRWDYSRTAAWWFFYK
ncbi:hypothetical protein [Halalkalirubrum salinum]|uniref:hypothetical protein n=1 Tax=Halalkalirubrum salinum TaxID=2563889 RepID=UPI0010FB2A72|nr:hypothetical protein [Halalkalirubrum salinum]